MQLLLHPDSACSFEVSSLQGANIASNSHLFHDILHLFVNQYNAGTFHEIFLRISGSFVKRFTNRLSSRLRSSKNRFIRDDVLRSDAIKSWEGLVEAVN